MSNTDFLGKPQEESQTQSGYIIINISGTLLACWGLNEDELHKVFINMEIVILEI
jgi:hypothetical protein